VNYCNAWGNGEAPWGENCPGWGSIWTPWEPEGEGVIEQNPLFVDMVHRLRFVERVGYRFGGSG
jgi:hypothetical protein